MLSKKLALIAVIAALASCSTNKKSSENFNSDKQNHVTEIKKLPEDKNSVVEEDEMFSVSADEIQKSGTKPHVIYFDTNSTKLDKEAVEILSGKVLPEAKDAKAKKVVIEAHCDERGTTTYNQRLSQKRADSVKNYLIKNGVKGVKIKSIGYGESKPVALGHDEESWAKNRRAVTIVIRK